MNAGDLRHRVVLQKKTVARDAMGGETVTWSDQATVWAAIRPLSARDRFLAQQVQPELTMRITIRYRSDIAADWRIKWGARVFDIIGPPIDPNMRHDELQLLCSEGVVNV